MPTYYSKLDKSHEDKSIQFDALGGFLTIPVVNVAAAQSIASVLSVVSIPQDCKIQHVSVTATALSVAGQPTFQLVSGNSTTIGAIGTPNVANPNGTPVFVSAQNVPLTANTQIVYNASVPDAVCDKTQVLALHAATAAGDTVTGLQVSIALVPVDPSPASASQTNFPNANPANF